MATHCTILNNEGIHSKLIISQPVFTVTNLVPGETLPFHLIFKLAHLHNHEYKLILFFSKNLQKNMVNQSYLSLLSIETNKNGTKPKLRHCLTTFSSCIQTSSFTYSLILTFLEKQSITIGKYSRFRFVWFLFSKYFGKLSLISLK